MWIGWELTQEPAKDDILTVKKHGVCKDEILASVVWNCPHHIILDIYCYVIMDETVEFLLNDKPIPGWVRPIINDIKEFRVYESI